MARKQLNGVVFFVFNPALVGSNLAKTITSESIVLLWFMPFNILATYIIGSILGWILIKCTRAPQHLKGLILGCCSAGNLGNLPIIIIPAVCREKGSPFGAPETCYKYGMAYVSLSMAIGAVYFWSYVYNIVRVSSSKVNNEDNREELPSTMNSAEGTPKFLQGDYTEAPLVCTKTEGIEKVVGFLIGVVPQIRNLMIGGTAPLRVITDSASLLGDAAIPIVSLVVGGNLLRGLKGSGIEVCVIVGIIAVRYIVLPLLGIVIVKGAVRVGMVHSHPLYQFVLLLQYAVPPAMNIGTVTQLFGAGESECSVVMLWTYAVAPVSLTLWSTLFMWLVG
ncbi:protein PIN-LIKES 1-like isoform X2 [Pistacia vera]|nr:protein PIN-LIKES 1-like isoform X2 [Pistacia vera]